MGMKIEDPKTLKLLPWFMRDDPADKALATAVDTLIKPSGSKVKTLRVWDQIDNLDEAMLDELAWEMDIDWYEDTMSIDVKRETIKTARLIKEHRGTKWAVEQVVANVFGTGEVQEWFEYGDEPFYFKITTDTQMTPDLFEKVKKHIEKVKNARSKLRTVEVEKNVACRLHFVGAISSSHHISVTNNPQRQRTVNGKPGIGSAAYATPHVAVRN